MKRHLIHQTISIKYFVSKLSPLAKRDAHARSARAPSSKHPRIKKRWYNWSINKVREGERDRFETKVPIVSTLRAETWRSLPSPAITKRFTIRWHHDCSFPWLSLRASLSSIAGRDSTLRKLGSKRLFFFYSSLVSTSGKDSSKSYIYIYISGVVILFFCKRRRKTEGKSVPSRARVDRSLIERSSGRRLNPDHRTLNWMQKGLQAGWGWVEAGTIMPRLKDRFERWRVSWLIMNIDGGWERSRNCFSLLKVFVTFGVFEV